MSDQRMTDGHPHRSEVIEGTDFYDIASDDQQFLMVRAALAGEGLRFILVQNFLEELSERLGN